MIKQDITLLVDEYLVGVAESNCLDISSFLEDLLEKKYSVRFNSIFKEAVRKRDDYTCQLCGFKPNNEKLHVHHVHYDNSNCWADAIALCRSCHGIMNGNKDYWEYYFENQLLERGLMYWSLST